MRLAVNGPLSMRMKKNTKTVDTVSLHYLPSSSAQLTTSYFVYFDYHLSQPLAALICESAYHLQTQVAISGITLGMQSDPREKFPQCT